MKKWLLIVPLVACVWSVVAHAQRYRQTELGIKTSVNATDIEIQFYNPSTVRVLKSPAGKTFDKKSLSVIALPQKRR